MLNMLKRRMCESIYNRAYTIARLEIMDEYHKHRDILLKKTASLKERERNVLEREEHIKTVEANVSDKIRTDLAEIIEEKKREKEEYERYKKGVQDFEKAIISTETRLIDWFMQLDRKQKSVFDEMQNDIDNLKKYQDEARKRGFEFEETFAGLLKANGYRNVKVTKKSGDFGADILAETKEGFKCVIQCKSYTKPVGVRAVQEVYAASLMYGCKNAIVATDNIFTKPAKVLAEELGVMLWDCSKVSEMQKEAEAG